MSLNMGELFQLNDINSMSSLKNTFLKKNVCILVFLKCMYSFLTCMHICVCLHEFVYLSCVRHQERASDTLELSLRGL